MSESVQSPSRVPRRRYQGRQHG